MRTSLSIRAFLLATAIGFSAGAAIGQSGDVDTSTMTVTELYQYAEALRLGRGVDADPATALSLHMQLAEAGRIQSYERMAVILLSQGRLEEAKAALETGSASGHELASRRLGSGHIQGTFGPLSDPEVGVALLEESIQSSDNVSARYTLARAYEQGIGTGEDPEKALALYQGLAAENHGPSLRRLGDFAQIGRVSDPDFDAAAEYYRTAGENGFEYSWLLLARLNLDIGDHQGAVDAFERAIEADIESATAEFARAHFLEELGPLSNRALGAQTLESGAEAGDVEIAAMALELWERRSRRINSLDLEGVVGLLDEEMRGGDSTATRALARAYRVLQWRLPNARARHAELVANYGDQLGNRYHREFFHSAYDTAQHSQSRQRIYEVASELDGEAFEDAARAIRSTELTAFVYLLQRELAELDYFSGRASGTFTNATLQATLNFCRDQGIMDTCIHGPLTSSASTDIVAALASARS